MTTIKIQLEKCTSGVISCPYCEESRTMGAGYAMDYHCGKNHKEIAHYVEFNSEIPSVPTWCPCKS